MVRVGTDSPKTHLFPAFQNWFGISEPTPSPPLAETQCNASQLIICHFDWWKRQLHPTSTSQNLLLVITSKINWVRIKTGSFFGVLSCSGKCTIKVLQKYVTLSPGREYSLGITVISYVPNPILNIRYIGERCNIKVFGPNSLCKTKPRLFKYKANLIPFNSEMT